uniref:Sigma-70 family RNA polymerase sigma factor n=1 Tax=Streptomyces sp. NBC_00049 TaxID=2903617 RepID=A0AAU2JXX9_9ACTN
MTEMSPQADTTPEPSHPYTLAALARLMLSNAHRDIAETALSSVATQDDSSATVAPGDFVRKATELLRLAERAQRSAVVYERKRGASWEDIGDALGITKQSAHSKFADYVNEWDEPFDKPERRHPDGTADDRRIPYGARYAPGAAAPANGSAEKTAAALDRWLRRHDDWADREHPVSGSLPRYSTMEMSLLVSHAAHRLRMDQLVPDPYAEADLWDYNAELQERMIRESERGGHPLHPNIDYPQEVARSRARATALREAAGHANLRGAQPAESGATTQESTR